MSKLDGPQSKVQPGERGLVFALGFILLASALAGEISGIVSVSNFLEASGANGILIVWIIDMAVMLVMTGLQSLFVDRFSRIAIMRTMTLGFVGAFVILRLLFTFGAPSSLTYGFLYLLSTQQLLIFPIFFWLLANDVFDMSQTKRLFPIIAGTSFMGSLLGIGFSTVQPALFARTGVPDTEVFTFNVLLYLAIYVVLEMGFKKVKFRETVQKTETVRETLTEGWQFVREVESFRYLMFALAALAICDVILEFRFLAILETTFLTADAYQRFYSLYRLGFVVLAFLLQTFVTGAVINKLSLKQIFFIYPTAALVGLLSMLGLPGIVTGVGGLLLEKLSVYAIDEPARKSFQALVPEERRGRVSIFMDSYLYAGGSIVGALLVLAVIGIGAWVGWSGYHYVYLGVGALAALFALWSIFQMRRVYDKSLFNWRIKRRQRRSSVLDSLDF
ncbi:MAG: hypothetical protein BWY63_01609 [Chloroflexi bacterium ADurb.Bin360]|nr:MAG: hypothetical protein BWY63_01609 [Chloroflexi bacterium ADurb.Bin360]